MSKAPAATWLCPVCGRRVPRREAECFCGAKQAQVEQHVQREAQRTSKRIPLDVAFFVVLLVLVGVYGVDRMTRDESDVSAAAGNPLAAIVAMPEPPPPLSLPASPPPRAPQPSELAAPAPAPPLFTLPPAPTPGAGALTAAPAPPPSPTPTPFDERAEVRRAGLAAYEAELQRLAAAAGRLHEHMGVYRRECNDSQKFGTATSNCGEIEDTIKREVSQIHHALDAAEDQARRAWLEPGTVRSARASSFFGTREWDELERAARTFKR